MSRLTRLATLAGIGLMLTALATTAAAQTKVKEEPIKAIGDVSGSSTFTAYCTPCHGVGGHGNGPAAAALKTAPPDLTLISQRAGGTFPFAKVKAQIAGDDVIAAHGSRDMPTWGPLFKAVETSNSVAELRLMNLVKYLENIQVK
jgi:mono/diheme cytochrome c family protein